MDDIITKLIEWEKNARDVNIAQWESLPEIELYMDQVINYIEKQLSLFQQVEEIKLITPSMINNYVKDGVLKHAVQKKYNKEHLACLIILGLLKQVLPLSKVSTLISGTDLEAENLYDLFIDSQKAALDGVLDKIYQTTSSLNGDEGDKDKLMILALRLSAEAFAHRIAAEKLLNIIDKKPLQNTENPKIDKDITPKKEDNDIKAENKTKLEKTKKQKKKEREEKLKLQQEKRLKYQQEKSVIKGKKQAISDI